MKHTRKHWSSINRLSSKFALVVFLIPFCPSFLVAQEISFVDLTNIEQRTELRFPPSPTPDCSPNGTCIGPVVGGASTCGPNPRDPRALAATINSVPTEITLDPFEVEIRILNSGSKAIGIPVSPHLSDLQPEDASQEFHYQTIGLVFYYFEHVPATATGFGHVELYGSTEHPSTIIMLKPGESIRVKAKIKLHTWPSAPGSGDVQANFWIHNNTFKPHAGGSFTEVVNDCINHTLIPNPIEVKYAPTRSPR
jgi:hypothetical protein